MDSRIHTVFNSYPDLVSSYHSGSIASLGLLLGHYIKQFGFTDDPVKVSRRMKELILNSMLDVFKKKGNT